MPPASIANSVYPCLHVYLPISLQSALYNEASEVSLYVNQEDSEWSSVFRSVGERYDTLAPCPVR